VTAIGIMSIIVASLSMLGSISGAFQAFFFAAMPLPSMTFTPTSSPPPPMVVTPPTLRISPGGSAPVSGLSGTRRQTVMAAMLRVHDLSSPRRQMLENALSDAGETFFAFAGQDPSEPAVRAQITSSGSDAAGGQSAAAADYFVLGQGRLELFDDRAVFYPVNAAPPLRWQGGTYSDSDGTPHLSAAQVSAIVQRVQSLTHAPLSSAQQNALTGQLCASSQAWITPALPVPSQMTAASYAPDGSLTIVINGQLMVIAPGGSVSVSGGGGGSGATSVAISAVISASSASTSPWQPFVMSAILQLLSLLVAIYLLVSGILVLGNSPAGARLHWIYVWLKIPIAIIAALALSWMMQSFVTSMGMPAGGFPFFSWSSVGIYSGFWGCAYPIALIFALRSRTVRAYYAEAAAVRAQRM
jgi:hypothetical protein